MLQNMWICSAHLKYLPQFSLAWNGSFRKEKYRKRTNLTIVNGNAEIKEYFAWVQTKVLTCQCKYQTHAYIIYSMALNWCLFCKLKWYVEKKNMGCLRDTSIYFTFQEFHHLYLKSHTSLSCRWKFWILLFHCIVKSVWLLPFQGILQT